MKKRMFVLTAVLIVVTLSACGTQTTPVYVTQGPELDAITADSDIFVENVLTGITNQDYTLFSTDFDETMSSAMKAADFEKICSIYSPLGAATSIELLNVQVVSEYYAVRYEVTYPEKTIVVRLVVDGNDPRKVSGLWFE